MSLAGVICFQRITSLTMIYQSSWTAGVFILEASVYPHINHALQIKLTSDLQVFHY